MLLVKRLMKYKSWWGHGRETKWDRLFCPVFTLSAFSDACVCLCLDHREDRDLLIHLRGEIAFPEASAPNGQHLSMHFTQNTLWDLLPANSPEKASIQGLIQYLELLGDAKPFLKATTLAQVALQLQQLWSLNTKQESRRGETGKRTWPSLEPWACWQLRLILAHTGNSWLQPTETQQ